MSDTKKPVTVVIDRTYGFGPGFSITEATWNDKTFTELRGGGGKRLRRSVIFAPVTKELAEEVMEVRKLRDEFHARAKVLREKLRAAMPS